MKITIDLIVIGFVFVFFIIVAFSRNISLAKVWFMCVVAMLIWLSSKYIGV